MKMLPFRQFKGHIPRVPAPELPAGFAKHAFNCDFAHADLRGVRDARIMWPNLQVAGKPPRTVYTEDGERFYAWAYDADVVKSLVVDDVHYRIYYTVMFDDGPLAKVARTHRNDNGVLTPVIGSNLVGGNFQPPENSTPGAAGGTNLGPDSWVLGVQRPKVQADIVEDNLRVVLIDKAAWPHIPRLAMRVTYFWEDLGGVQVSTVDISNTEAAIHPNTGVAVPNVFYTNDDSKREIKIQDMLWPLGYTPRPYKYYFFNPPELADAALSRIVTVTNTDTSLPIVVHYAGPPEPPPHWPGGGGEGYPDSGGGAGGDGSSGGSGGDGGGDV